MNPLTYLTQGAKGGAAITGYGAIGMFLAMILNHRWPWIEKDVVVMSVTSLCHSAQTAFATWLAFKRYVPTDAKQFPTLPT
jgi:hypothetical protein